MKPIFEVRHGRILEESERVMRNRMLKYMKVLWSQQTECEATWGLESRMGETYKKCSWRICDA
jgi:hypothetical protein